MGVAEGARSAQTSRVRVEDEEKDEVTPPSSGKKNRARIQLTGWMQVGKVCDVFKSMVIKI